MSTLFFSVGTPPRPNWDAVKRERAAVLFPNANAIGFTAGLNIGTIPIAVLDDYLNHRRKLFVRAVATYKGVFQKEHFVQVCASHAFGEPADTFLFCKNDNEIDGCN